MGRCVWVIGLLPLFIANGAQADVGFAAPVFADKSKAHVEKTGEILLDSKKKKFFAVEDVTTGTWTAFNSTVPMITCWQGFRPSTPGAEGRWRRVGDSMELMVRFNVSNAALASQKEISFSLPMGYKAKAIDGEILGQGVLSGQAKTQSIDIRYDEPSQKLRIYLRNANGESKTVNERSLATADFLNFKTQVNIEGWSDSAPNIDDEC